MVPMIIIGADHGGFHLKETIKEFLKENNYEFKDLGTNGEDSVDYPDYAFAVASAVAKGEGERGILVCGTGIGMSITANKVEGIRAALCHDTFSARMARAHNNAQILCLGQRVVGEGLALEIVKAWLESEFEGGRHCRRVDKITAGEKEQ